MLIKGQKSAGYLEDQGVGEGGGVTGEVTALAGQTANVKINLYFGIYFLFIIIIFYLVHSKSQLVLFRLVETQIYRKTYLLFQQE